MASGRHWEQDKDSTLYIGNLAEQTTDAQIWELMLQAGPIVNVHLPKDRVTQVHQGYGFVEFASEEDADYAVKIMNQIRLWGKPIRVNKASADKRIGPGGVEGGGSQGVGAELFVGNLDGMVDERVLFETFSRFGPLLAPPKVARDDSNLSKGYAFISYASFEAADDAIANMHGQYLMNKEVTIQYAFKKDGKGERHGDAAERALALQAKRHNIEVAIPAMPAALVMPNGAPSAPAAMGAMGGNAPPVRPPALPAGSYGGMPPQTPYGVPSQQAFVAFPPPPMQGYAPAPPPQAQGYAFPARPAAFGPPSHFAASPLQAPSAAGLPPRPPPSAFPGPPGMPPGMGGPPGYANGVHGNQQQR